MNDELRAAIAVITLFWSIFGIFAFVCFVDEKRKEPSFMGWLFIGFICGPIALMTAIGILINNSKWFWK